MKTFRKLKSYKTMHYKTAREKGCIEDFQDARTLTEARKILFGVKPKQTPLRRQGRKKLADL